MRELFPELLFVADAKDGGAAGAAALQPSSSPADLMIVVRMTQLMEDVWIGCQLDRWWDHPLNLGSAPSYRFWWPIISPMYSPGLRRFVEERFPRPGPPDDVTPAVSTMRIPQRGRVQRLDPIAPEGLAALWWKHRSTQPRSGTIRQRRW